MRITSAKQLREEYNNSGYIYISQCEDFPNIYKVGWTISIYNRMNDLQREYKTFGKFICINYYRSKSARILERIIHKRLNDWNVNMKNPTHGGNAREFFKCDINIIIETIQKCIEEDNNQKKQIENKYLSIWEQQYVQQ